MIEESYLISYEGPCNPQTESCFIYCETEECLEPFYYSIIEREAASLSAVCGKDSVLDCESSQSCLANENMCSVTFCTEDDETDCAGPFTNSEPVI